MSNYEYDSAFIGLAETRLMKKRARCKCTYMKCQECGRSHDNLFNEKNEENKLLIKIIKFYEEALNEMNVTTLSIEYLIEFGIINTLLKKRKGIYESNKKNGNINMGRF